DDGLDECRLVGDEVIGRQNEHHRIVAMPLGDAQRRRSDRCRSTPPERLENVRRREIRVVDLAELVLCLEEELAIGDREHLGDEALMRAAQESLLEQALAIGKANEWLGM